MIIHRCTVLLCCLFLSTASFATKPLEEVVVSGKQPGPGMWRITKGDNELWLFGSLSPLPKKMDWDSSSVEAILDDADRIIDPAGLEFDISLVRQIFLLPSLRGIKRNPDKQKLKDVLSETDYRRWQRLKQQYLPNKKSLEKQRPLFASYELLKAAMKDNDLSYNRAIWKLVKKKARKNKIERIETKIIRPLPKARKYIKQFKKESIDDQVCFNRILDRVEFDLPILVKRANAWAEGDMQRLRAIPYTDAVGPCMDIFSTTSFAEELELENIDRLMQEQWLTAVRAALDEVKVSFAVLPMFQLLEKDGVLSQLAAMGYEIRHPR